MLLNFFITDILSGKMDGRFLPLIALISQMFREIGNLALPPPNQ
jgi:hypothetical protein